MKNLYIDNLTKDLVVEGNQLKFTSNNAEFLSQKIENYLLFFRGEWFLDFERGVPYISRDPADRNDPSENFFIKNPDLNFINSYLGNEILGIDGVEKIISFKSVLNNDRTFDLNFSVQITTGEIISGGIII